MLRQRCSQCLLYLLPTLLIHLLYLVCPTRGGPIHQADDEIDFRRQVQPILARHCFACHGFDEESREAGLRLDLRESAVEAGAIDPADLANSLLTERIFSDDPAQIMPPPGFHKPLSPEDKEILRRWILAGAEYAGHWAFEKPVKPVVPRSEPDQWMTNPIDHFIERRLSALNLQPAPPLDPELLFRRICFDLTGLPPDPGQSDLFVSEFRTDPQSALSNWIDRLQETPAWAEHQARYWLDAARYADTHGMHFDNYREMWPYRDWVIRALQKNQPFDQFIVEQLAGDLLPDPQIDQLIATGFQRCNITTNEGGTIVEENLALYAADRVQTFGWVFLGLTINCAQCHDHKFDPISIQDYYRIAAFFRNTDQPGLDGNNKEGNFVTLKLPTREDQARLDQINHGLTETEQVVQQFRESSLARFMQSLRANQPGDFQRGISEEKLTVHLPLTNQSMAPSIPQRPEEITGLQLDPPAGWSKSGKLPGSALNIGPSQPLSLGEIGQWDFNRPFSFGGWIKVDNIQGRGAIIARMDNQRQYRGWDLMQEGRRLSVHLIDSWPENSIKLRTHRDVLNDGQWHHVFVSYDGTAKIEGVRIYVDGSARGTQVDNNTLKPESSMLTGVTTRIGQRETSDQWTGGKLQDLRFYDRRLETAEIAAIAWQGEWNEFQELGDNQRTGERIKQLHTKYLEILDPDYQALLDQRVALSAERQQIEDRSPITHIWKERENSEAKTFVLMRGEYDKIGEEVSANTPGFLPAMRDDWPKNRLGLARWLVDRENPLTARVTVNRIWQQIFGQGIVVTTEDFGVMGASPTHPELLDWLACEFQDLNWDLRKLYKLILMSSTYRQSALVTEEKLLKDPDNLHLSRGPRFRMDGEMIRDLALQASGLLSGEVYGPSVKPYQPENIWNVVGLPEGNTRQYQPDRGSNLYRRSVYTFWKRMAPPPNLEIFNAPNREVCTVRRDRTNTPLQALVTLNDIIFVESARKLAERILGEELLDDQQRMHHIARLLLNRQLTEAELRLVSEDLEFYRDHYRSQTEAAVSLIAVGESPVQIGADPPELAAWTMVCQQLINLDETINK
jgi:hypothetical protein